MAGGGSFRARGGSFRAAGCSPLLFLFVGNTSQGGILSTDLYKLYDDGLFIGSS